MEKDLGKVQKSSCLCGKVAKEESLWEKKKGRGQGALFGGNG